jgi:hypothetical protein
MAHTNNLKRAARTHYPAVSQKKKKVSTRSRAHSDYPTNEYDALPVEEDEEVVVAEPEEGREAKAALITEYHALEKQLASSKGEFRSCVSRGAICL